MATVDLPDVDYKNFWRRFRATVWTVLCAFAAGVFLKVIPVPDFLGGLIGWIYFAALFVFFWPYFARRFNV